MNCYNQRPKISRYENEKFTKFRERKQNMSAEILAENDHYEKKQQVVGI